MISSYGDKTTITGSPGDDTIRVQGDHNLVKPGDGLSQVSIGGSGDTVDAGAHTFLSLATITVGGSKFQFNDGAQTYFDTVVGFNKNEGDRIHLTSESPSDAIAHSKQVNHGQDTLITLNDGSSILLKGVTHIDHGFFN